MALFCCSVSRHSSVEVELGTRLQEYGPVSAQEHYRYWCLGDKAWRTETFSVHPKDIYGV